MRPFGWVCATLVCLGIVGGGCGQPAPIERDPVAEAEYLKRRELQEKGELPAFKEHMVIVRLKLEAEEPSVAERRTFEQIGNRVKGLVEQSRVGEYDGIEFLPKWGEMYFFGPDGEKLYSSIGPKLKQLGVPRGSYIIVRYGRHGSPEKRFDL